MFDPERFGSQPPENGYYDKFSGKDLDDELDDEQGLDEISSEEQAADLKNALDEISAKIPSDFRETIMGVIDSVGLYLDPAKPEWDEEVIEPLNEVMDEISMADSDEIMEREDEFADRLSSIQKASQGLTKKKVH